MSLKNQAKSFVLSFINTPFGKYKYKCLPMGLKYTLEFTQQVMEIEDTIVYLNIIDAFSFTWEHPVLLLEKILQWLEANGFTVNLLTFKLAIQEAD